MFILKEIQHFMKEIKKMFQQILDLLARIKTDLDTIAAGGSGGLTVAQTAQLITSLTALAQQADKLAGVGSGTGVTVSGASPNPAAIGGQTTISGTGFGATQGSGLVDFNGVQASVVQWADQSIVVVVPTGSTTGSLTVTNNAGAKASTSFAIQ